MDVMLAFSGEKLVSLEACSVVDDGTIHHSSGAYFRGRGIFKQLLQAMGDFVTTKFPNVLRRRFVIPEQKAAPSYKKLCDTGNFGQFR